MAKKRRRADHPRRPERRPIRHRPSREPAGPETTEFFRMLRSTLRSEHPMDFLQAVSGVLEVTGWLHSPLAAAPSTSLDEIVESFEGTDYAQTTAALRVIEELTDDDLLRARVRRTLRERTQPLPAWLAHLGETRIERVEFLGHVLGDGDDYLLDVRFAGAERATALVYVDHNMGGVVKDAFVINEPIESVLAISDREGDEGSTRRTADPAEARATIEAAVRLGAAYHPPFESDTWPIVRPLVLWLAGLLPDGGTATEPREWEEAELDEIADGFLGSRWGAAYDDPDGREVLDGLLWLATSYGPGDPLLWSQVRIEIIMADLFPRKVLVPPAAASRLPDLLADFVRFGHATRKIPASLTAEVLAAIEHWRATFEAKIEGAEPSYDESLEAILAKLSGDRLAWTARAVGGPEALDRLDTVALPDEPFDWEGVPDDLTEKVGGILALCDENADRFLDVEHRTANRRLLRRLVDADPHFFRGRAGARTSAAAVCWLVARANDSVGPYAEVTTAGLMAPFRVSGGGERARRFLGAIGVVDSEPWEPVHLGSADLLVAARRHELIELRDRGADPS